MAAVYLGDDGVAAVPFTAAKSIAIIPGGRIVVAGVETDTTDSWALTRYNTDGTPDSGYLGTGDMLSGDVAGSAAAVCVQADGAIVLAGTAAGTTTHAALARYTSGGLGVLVNDVAPASLTVTVSDATYDETNEMSLTGSFSDPATQEPHRLVVNWGDGTPAEKFYIAPGETSFEVPARQYAQSGEYTVSVKVADSGGDSPWVSLSSPLVYSNVTPSDLQLNLSAPTIDQYQDAWLSGSFTDPGWMESRTVSIHWDDSTSDTTLTLTDGDSYFQASHPYNASGGHTITVTVADGEGSAQEAAALSVTHVAPVVEIVATDPSASETGPHAGQITLTRSGPLLDQALTVTLSVSGTAVEGTDYVTFSHTVAFAADESSTSFAVTPITEDLQGGSKTVHVSLASGSEYEPGERQSATVTIRDDYLPVLSIEATDPVADGSTAHAGQITIKRTGPTTDPLIVHLSSSGSAEAGVQYQALPNSVTIPEGQSSCALAVTPVQNGEIDGDGLLTVTLEPSDLYSDSDYGLPDESFCSANVQAEDDLKVTIQDVVVQQGETVVFTIKPRTLSRFGHSATLSYLTQDGTASSADYVRVESGRPVEINADDTEFRISVETKADRIITDDRTFTLVLTMPNGEQEKAKCTIRPIDKWIGDGWKQTYNAMDKKWDYTAKAQAGDDKDTLRQLAKDITGDANDWFWLSMEDVAKVTDTATLTVKKGTVINVAPLLEVLEIKMRANVVQAAKDLPKYATFGGGTEEAIEKLDKMGAAGIESVFTAQGTPPKPRYDCVGMAVIVEAKGLVDTIGAGRLSKLGLSVRVIYNAYFNARHQPADSSGAHEGDILTLLNNELYAHWHANGHWRMENVITTAPKVFWGWDGAGGSATSEDGWRRDLLDHFNDDSVQVKGRRDVSAREFDQHKIWENDLSEIPGFVPGPDNGNAVFWNVAKLAATLFARRREPN